MLFNNVKVFPINFPVNMDSKESRYPKQAIDHPAINANHKRETLSSAVTKLKQILEQETYKQDFQALEDCCFSILLTLLTLIQEGRIEEAQNEIRQIFDESDQEPSNKNLPESGKKIPPTTSKENLHQTSENNTLRTMNFVVDWMYQRLELKKEGDGINTLNIKLKFLEKLLNQPLTQQIQAITTLDIEEILDHTKSIIISEIEKFWKNFKKRDISQASNAFYRIYEVFVLHFISNDPRLSEFIAAFQRLHKETTQQSPDIFTPIAPTEENAVYYLIEFYTILGHIFHFFIRNDAIHQTRTT